MALGDVASNLSELVASFPVEVSDKILDLVLVMKTLGVLAILYVVYAIAMGIFTYRRVKKVGDLEKKADAIDKKVDSIDRKLDKLLKKKGKN